MSDIPTFAHSLLWASAKLFPSPISRADGGAVLALAPKVPVRAQAMPYPLADANGALDALRAA